MDVAPGEVIHMDEHGAVKFPSSKIQAVADNCRKLQAKEDDNLARVRACKTSAEIRQILTGHAYGSDDKSNLKKRKTK